jgi:hypothetical protein
VTGDVQLRLNVGDVLPLDPVAMAEVPIEERRDLYDAIGLDPEQRIAIERAVGLVVAGWYGGRSGR